MPEPKLELTEEELVGLNQKQRTYYKAAREAFEKEIPEAYFLSDFAFYGMNHNYFFEPPLPATKLLEQPLYLVVEQMWLKLGVQQGTMKASSS